MNYETNVRQLVVLDSMYTFFFLDMQLAKRLFNTTPTAPLPNTRTLTLIIIHVKFDFFFYLSHLYLN